MLLLCICIYLVYVVYIEICIFIGKSDIFGVYLAIMRYSRYNKEIQLEPSNKADKIARN